MENISGINTLISNLEKRINEWNVEHSNLEFVFNQELYKNNYAKVKYIIVGDNPGENEKEQGKYLVGVSGFYCRNMLKSIFFINDFTEEILVLNKTPIYSNQTEKLKNICLEDEDAAVLFETQKIMADLIYKIQRKIGCDVIIIGKGAGSFSNRDKILGKFYEQILNIAEQDNEFKNSLYQFNHISNNQLAKQIIELYPDPNNWTKENILGIGKRAIEDFFSNNSNT